MSGRKRFQRCAEPGAAKFAQIRRPRRTPSRLIGFTVQYHRASLLLESLALAQHDGSIFKLRSQVAKVRLLVLDDCLAPITDRNRLELIEFDRRAGRRDFHHNSRPVTRSGVARLYPVIPPPLTPFLTELSVSIRRRPQLKRLSALAG